MSNITYLFLLVSYGIMHSSYCAERTLPFNLDPEADSITSDRSTRNGLRPLIALTASLALLGGAELVSCFVNNDDPMSPRAKIGSTIALGLVSPACTLAAYLLHKNARRAELSLRSFSILSIGRDVALATAFSAATFACTPWAPYTASIALRLAGGGGAIGVGINRLHDLCKKLYEIETVYTE